jgi:hypothetical protein
MEKYYYVGAGNQACGPILPTEFQSNGLTADTLVCRVGDQAWTRLGDIPELLGYVAPAPPKAPQAPSVPQPPYGQPQQPYGQPQQPYTQPQQPYNANNYPPSNNMVWAVLSTILCCIPTGIYAIIRASKVNELWAMGQFDESRKAAKDAATWSIIGAVLSLVFGFIYGIALVAADM